MDVSTDVVFLSCMAILALSYGAGWYFDQKAEGKMDEVDAQFSDRDFYSPELPKKEANTERLDL